ncbi:MAG: hypothetical protein GY950_34885, partial [bacterium]|nr:hypothetical protein [bacterium]
MYLKRFQVENLWDGESCRLDFQGKDNTVKRWSVIDGWEPAQTLVLFKLFSLCLGAKSPGVSSLAAEISEHRYQKDKPIRFVAELYPDLDKNSTGSRIIHAGGEVSASGKIHLTSGKNMFTDLQPLGNFAYGYYADRGGSHRLKSNYSDVSRQRNTRFETFFGDDFPALPVNDWLFRQYRNAARYNSKTAEDRYNTTLTAVTGLLPGLGFSHWESDHTILFTLGTGKYPISQLPANYIAAVEFLVDFTRQLSDSRVNSANFNPGDGILFIHQLEKVFPLQNNPGAARILSDIFPNMQFILTCGQKEMAAYIKQMEEKTLPSRGCAAKIKKWVVTKPGKKSFNQEKNNFKRNRFPVLPPASEDTVVLIDVDSKIPNLALMKISGYYKAKGRNVILTRDSSIHRNSKKVFASSVFKNKTTQNKIKRLKKIHGDNITFGGSGVNVFNQLPTEIESLVPDFSLYPGVDFGIDFLTRGCNHRCGFCLVPKKEGTLRLV